MTEKQKEWIKKYHSRFPAEYMIGETRPKSAAQKEIEELFPEAFAEPKPERVKHEQIFKYSWDGYDDDKIWEGQLTLLFKEYAKSVIIPERFDNITIKEVTELPAPEGKGRFVGYSFYGLDDCKPELNGWTDELVSKFVDEWEKYEGERFANCMEDFKQKNNIK